MTQHNIPPRRIPGAVRILKEVRSNLWDGTVHSSARNRFICETIDNTPGRDDTKDDLHRWINALLVECDGYAHYTYEMWLYATHGIVGSDCCIKLQTSRRAWIDWMINELEAVK